MFIPTRSQRQSQKRLHGAAAVAGTFRRGPQPRASAVMQSRCGMQAGARRRTPRPATVHEIVNIPLDEGAPPFIERIERIGNDLRIVRLCGRIDFATVPAAHRYLEPFLRDGRVLRQNLLLDCAPVEHIDASAVALLVACTHDYIAKNHTVAVINPTSEVRGYLELARLTDHIHIYPSESDAVAAMRDPL